MAAPPFLTLRVRTKKDILALRCKARQVASLLRFDVRDQTCIAAGAFLVGQRALESVGPVDIGFVLEHKQLHIAVQALAISPVYAGQGSGAPAEPCATNLMRLSKELPTDPAIELLDVAWLVGQIDTVTPRKVFDEIAKQNQDVLRLLHEVRLYQAEAKKREEKSKEQDAA